jgi:hypothetical protein
MTFNDINVPFAATVFAAIAFSSSGVLNVILYTLTRPKLLPRRERAVSLVYNTQGWKTTSAHRGHQRNDSQAKSFVEHPKHQLEEPVSASTLVVDISSHKPTTQPPIRWSGFAP